MIESARLRIRPLKLEDAKIFSDLRNQDYVRKYNVMEIISKEDAEKIIEKLEEDEGWAIEILDDSRFIGTIFKDMDSLRFGTGTCEISYWLGEEYACKGYMKEAIEAFIAYIFSKDYEGITVRVFEDNAKSVHLIEKLGFEKQGRLTNAVKSSDGVIHNDLLYYLNKL